MSFLKRHIIGKIIRVPFCILAKCLNGMIIDSTGIAKQHQPSLLGLYSIHKLGINLPTLNGARSFKHANHNSFLIRATPYEWRVSKGIMNKFFDSDYG